MVICRGARRAMARAGRPVRRLACRRGLAVVLGAPGPAAAHGLDGTGVLLLLGGAVALLLLACGALVGLAALLGLPRGDQPGPGWQRGASRLAAFLLLGGLLVGGVTFVVSVASHSVAGRRTVDDPPPATATAQQPAPSPPAADGPAVALPSGDPVAVRDALDQCLRRSRFVGRWHVERQGASYEIDLLEGGDFKLADLYDNAGRLPLAPAGRWRVERQPGDSGGQIDWVWIVGEGRGRSIRQPIEAVSGAEFALRDAAGQPVRYRRVGHAPDTTPCLPPEPTERR